MTTNALSTALQDSLKKHWKQFLIHHFHSSAWIFAGNPDALLRESLLLTAQYLQCERRHTIEKDWPCEHCLACKQIRENRSPWVKFLEPNEDQDTVGVDEVRKISEAQAFGTLGARYRIFIIPRADRLQVQSANALLKVVEEPPQNWVFLFGTSDAKRVLPTLASRCHHYRLPHLNSGEFWTWAHASNEEGKDLEEKVQNFLKTPQAKWHELSEWAGAETSRTDMLLSLLETHLHQQLSAAIATPTKLSASFNRLESLYQVRREISAPINRKLHLSMLLSQWIS